MLLMLYLVAITAEAMTGALSAGRRGMDGLSDGTGQIDTAVSALPVPLRSIERPNHRRPRPQRPFQPGTVGRRGYLGRRCRHHHAEK